MDMTCKVCQRGKTRTREEVDSESGVQIGTAARRLAVSRVSTDEKVGQWSMSAGIRVMLETLHLEYSGREQREEGLLRCHRDTERISWLSEGQLAIGQCILEGV